MAIAWVSRATRLLDSFLVDPDFTLLVLEFVDVPRTVLLGRIHEKLANKQSEWTEIERFLPAVNRRVGVRSCLDIHGLQTVQIFFDNSCMVRNFNGEYVYVAASVSPLQDGWPRCMAPRRTCRQCERHYDGAHKATLGIDWLDVFY